MNRTSRHISPLHRVSHLLKATLVMLLLLWAGSARAAGPIQLKASLDSTSLLMGKQTTLYINLVQDRGQQGHFLNVGDTLTSAIDVVDPGMADTTDIGSGREEIRRSITIQAFDSGLYTIPPFVYVAGRDTIYSNDLPLKVIPCNVDSLTTVHDYADTVDGGWRLWDFLPDIVVDYWWVILGVALLIVAVSLYFLLRKKKVADLLPKKKPLPPYEVAMQELTRLKESKLCERGQEKEYYTRLTEILRVYLYQRFGINAMEMTSTQIMQRVNDHSETKPSAALMKQILEMADFVKFANVRPMPDDNVKSFNMATRFVEDTKPAPEPETDEDDDEKSTADATASTPKETNSKDSKK